MFGVGNGQRNNAGLVLVLLAVWACAGPRTAGVTPAAPGRGEVKAPVTLPLVPKSRERMLPMGLVVTGSPLLASPAWVKRSLARATGIGNPGSGEVAAFQGGGWGAGILGALSIILGIFLLAEPALATLALPWIAGIVLVVGGIALVYFAFKSK